MQIRQFFMSLTARAAKPAEANKAPTPIDAADFAKVAGGLPNGTWPPSVEAMSSTPKSKDS